MSQENRNTKHKQNEHLPKTSPILTVFRFFDHGTQFTETVTVLTRVAFFDHVSLRFGRHHFRYNATYRHNTKINYLQIDPTSSRESIKMGWFTKSSESTGQQKSGESTEQQRCSFCFKDREEVALLIQGTDVYICDECVATCTDVIEEDRRKKAGEAQPITLEAPALHTLREALDAQVVGQEKAKKALMATLRIHHLSAKGELQQKTPIILLAGPAGCGKTSLLAALRQQTTLPSNHVDCSRLTATGYIGEDVENFLDDLYKESGKILENAQNGLLLFDGLQRLVYREAPAYQKDVAGQGAQRALIRILDGQTCQISAFRPRHPQHDTFAFRCDQLMIVLTYQLQKPPAEGERIQDILVEAGLLQELVSRIDTVVVMSSLQKSEHLQAMKELEGKFLQSSQQAVQALGGDISVDEDVLDMFAEYAAQAQDGAWALRSFFSRLTQEFFLLENPQQTWQVTKEEAKRLFQFTFDNP